MHFVALVASESDVTYRGQKTIRNKDGVKINNVRWTLSPANMERPDVKQDCKAETRQHNEGTSDRDENVLRCSTGTLLPLLHMVPLGFYYMS